MKTFLFVLIATVFEATGDAIVRVAIHGNRTFTRILLYGVGVFALALYGTCLNLAPVEFGQVVGLYIATLFVMFQITNYLFFKTAPNLPSLVGGTLVVVGGLIVALWKPISN